MKKSPKLYKLLIISVSLLNTIFTLAQVEESIQNDTISLFDSLQTRKHLFNSSQGYTIEFSDDWFVISTDTVTNILTIDTTNPFFKELDPSFQQKILNGFKSGKYDWFIQKKDPLVHVSIRKHNGKLPEDEEGLLFLEKKLKQTFNPDFLISKFEDINGNKMIYLNYNTTIDAAHFQYVIPVSESEYLSFTYTFPFDGWIPMNEQLEAHKLVSNIKVDYKEKDEKENNIPLIKGTIADLIIKDTIFHVDQYLTLKIKIEFGEYIGKYINIDLPEIPKMFKLGRKTHNTTTKSKINNKDKKFQTTSSCVYTQCYGTNYVGIIEIPAFELAIRDTIIKFNSHYIETSSNIEYVKPVPFYYMLENSFGIEEKNKCYSTDFAIYNKKYVDTLILSNKSLDFFAQGLQYLKKLKLLDVSDNSLNEIPCVILNLPKLQSIMLENNNIVQLDCIDLSPSLEKINLRNNPLSKETLKHLKRICKKSDIELIL